MQAKRNENCLAVMFLDLDRFKVVNDTFGHGVGDSLLQQVSLRLKACLRRCDTLSRIGGDEFTAVLPELNGFRVRLRPLEGKRADLSDWLRHNKNAAMAAMSVGFEGAS